MQSNREEHTPNWFRWRKPLLNDHCMQINAVLRFFFFRFVHSSFVLWHEKKRNFFHFFRCEWVREQEEVHRHHTGATQKKNDNRFKIVNAMGKEKLSLKNENKDAQKQRDLWLKEKAWQQQKYKKKTRRRKKGKKILQEVINYMVKKKKITREWKKKSHFKKKILKADADHERVNEKNKNKTSIIRKLISIFVVVVCLCVNGHCVCLFMLVFMSGKHHESKMWEKEIKKNNEICIYGRRVPKSVRGKFTHYVDFLKNEIYLYTFFFSKKSTSKNLNKNQTTIYLYISLCCSI